MKLIYPLLALYLLPLVARAAELHWQATTVNLSAPAGQEELHARFPFTCTGEGTVTVKDIRTSCGCTAATLEKRTYQPGDSSAIEVTFRPGLADGRQVKEVFVTTDSGTETLQLVADLKVWFRIAPRLLLWRLGQPAEEKIVAIEFPDAATPETPTVANDAPDKIHATLVTVEPGHRYELHLTPASTAVRGESLVHVNLKSAAGLERKTAVYAVVR